MGKVQLPVYVAQAEGAGEDERVKVKGRMRSFFIYIICEILLGCSSETE